MFPCIYVSHLLQPFINGHQGCFHVLAIVNHAAMNTGVHVSFHITAFVFYGYIPRSGIAGSYSNSIFSCLRILHTVLHSGHIDWHFHQPCGRGSLFSTPSPVFIICKPFRDDHSDQCEMVPHCGFDLYFYNYQRQHFSCGCLPSVCLLWRNVNLDLLSNF